MASCQAVSRLFFFWGAERLYLLYLDESGNPDDPADRHFVLAGAAVHERQTYWLSREMEEIQARYFPGVQPITFHASEIRSGRGFWRKVQPDVRRSLLEEMAQKVREAPPQQVVLFATVIEKDERLHGEEAVRRATEEICRRFDLFLTRKHHEGDSQRGLLVFAESSYQKRAKIWVRDFRELGTTWGVLNNLSDIPYFATPAETRLLQVADFISHAVYLLYERRNPALLRHLMAKFDRKGKIHGLVHVGRGRGRACDCPRCWSERDPSTDSPWLNELVGEQRVDSPVLVIPPGIEGGHGEAAEPTRG